LPWSIARLDALLEKYQPLAMAIAVMTLVATVFIYR
jgi:hypothetical protein